MRLIGHSLKALAAIICLLSSYPATADVVRWTLEDVTFDDNATATGFFDLDTSRALILNWSIGVSGGNEAIFPAFNYNPSTSRSLTNPGQAQIPQVVRFIDLPIRLQERVVVLQLPEELTDLGGEVYLLLDDGLGNTSRECFNCNPVRLIVSGKITGAPLPSPISVLIDIRPSNENNYISENSNGVVPVAILGSQTFDASTVDEQTILIQTVAATAAAGETATNRGRNFSVVQGGSPVCAQRDSNRDGFDDLVCPLDFGMLFIPPGVSTVELIAETFDGTVIFGTDTILKLP